MEREGSKLEEAQRLRDRGDNSYQSGEYKDARDWYNQILSLLSSEVTPTEEEEERRDVLMSSAHEKLAECAFELEEYHTVIEHCNVVTVDKESAKKIRGKAYQKLADQDFMALRRKTEKQTSSASGNDQQQNTEYHEMVLEHEATLRGYEDCRKRGMHDQFKAVDQFCVEDLPETLRRDNILQLIKDNLVKLTVLLKVERSSANRPQTVPGTRTKYPFSANGGEVNPRRGSGYVGYVILSQKNDAENCPCCECKKPEQQRKDFAKIFVVTAAHVVFDGEEGKVSKCYFDYDPDNACHTNCLYLDKAVKVINDNIAFDVSCLTFITHDMEFAENLRKVWENLMIVSQKVKLECGVYELYTNLTDDITHLHKQFDMTQMEIETLKNILNTSWGHTDLPVPDRGPESTILQYGLKLRATGGNVAAESLNDVRQLSDIHTRMTEEMHALKDNVGSYFAVRGYKYVLEEYQRLRTGLKDTNRKLYGIPAEPLVNQIDGFSDAEPIIRQFYNHDYPHTIIVSHPHGRSKKISIGTVDKRRFIRGYDTVSYVYKTATCPGSSGAPVFILGRLRGTPLQPHSCVHELLSQTNESGVIIGN